MPAHLYPRISATSPSLKRDMLWQDLLKCGEAGATAGDLAARLIAESKATGTIAECALALEPLLDELVRMPGPHQTTRDGDRYKTRRQEA
jgi:hypothetical protein